MEPVLMNEFRRLSATVRAELLAAAARVVDSGHYVLGKEVAAFESEWGAFCGTKHAVGVANGMDAIEIGLRAMGFAPGDEVITTPMTAFATILGIIRAGASPVLADIDPATGQLDPASAERCVGPRTRAILVVHLYGQICAVERWEELCARHQLVLLEDAAQAHGAEWRGRRAGAIGRWAAYSFYPTKNLGCLGDGGAFCTNDDALAQKARMLRNYGQSERYHHPEEGLNSRLDELQASFLRALLVHLPEATVRRRDIAGRYRAEMRGPRIGLLAPPAAAENHVHHLFVLRTRDRNELQAHLAKHGVQSLIHYPICAHRQPPASQLRRDPQGLGAAELFAENCLSVPCHPFLSDGEIDRVIQAVNAF
jgi:dTDP-4-amino-4,6-dideoxygalactose transaminase